MFFVGSIVYGSLTDRSRDNCTRHRSTDWPQISCL